MSSTDDQEWVGVDYLTRRYGISRTTVWIWRQKGYLPEPELVRGGVVRWRRTSIEAADAKVSR